MKIYLEARPDGLVIARGTCGDSDTPNAIERGNAVYVLDDAPMIDFDRPLFIDGEGHVQQATVRPSQHHDFDASSQSWRLSPRARALLWEQIKAMRDARSESGGVPVAGKWFHSDLKSRTQWERMVNRSASLPDSAAYVIGGQAVVWKTMDGSFIPLTVGLIRGVVAAMEAQELLTFAAAERHKAALFAADDPTIYDYSTGWPAIYTP